MVKVSATRGKETARLFFDQFSSVMEGKAALMTSFHCKISYR